ncbi:WD40 repeat domain-containing protein [Pantanalinema rosaneae CENA516]|uniref:WD40 repeat domain-containing protein n=1 Tax=Pantanalinema rosaneae TaxID=1620701 RepID=UPI003D6DE483
MTNPPYPIVRKRLLRLMLGITLVLCLIGTWIVWQTGKISLESPTCLTTDQTNSICYRLRILSTQSTTAIATHPTGSILASNFRERIQLWDLQTGKLLRSLYGHHGWITALAISADGKMLASASLDSTIRLWDVPTGTLLGTLNAGRMTHLAFSPDGKQLASSNQTSQWADQKTSAAGVVLWDVTTQQLRQQISRQPTTAIAFSPDSQLLAISHPTVEVWSLGTQQMLYSLNLPKTLALGFTPDGRWLVTGGDTINTWNANTGQPIYTRLSPAAEVALSPNGSLLATVEGSIVHLWQVRLPRYLGDLRGSNYSRILVNFGLFGRAIVIAGSDGIRLWQQQSQHQSTIGGRH